METDLLAPRRPAAAAPPHLPALDGVRGVAVLLVVAHMMNVLVAPSDAAGRALSFVLHAGWIGVQLFFVLSGFLITGILLDTRAAPNYLPAFFARRLLRILPLYYATLLVAFVLLPALGRAGPALAHDRAHQIWLWTYLSNWVAPYEAGSHLFPHFWSLAVEEQFYLLWPFALFGGSPRRCLALGLGLGVACLAVRLGMLLGGGSPDAIYTFTVTRMDALTLGAAAAAALRVPAVAERWLARRDRLWGAFAVVGLAGALVTRGYPHETFLGASVGYTFLSVAFAFGVLAAATSEPARAPAAWLRSPALRALGKYSYGMYVFHKPLHDFVGRPLLRRLGVDASRSAPLAAAYVACGLLVTFFSAYASYHLFEKRFLRLKAHFVPRLAESEPIK